MFRRRVIRNTAGKCSIMRHVPLFRGYKHAARGRCWANTGSFTAPGMHGQLATLPTLTPTHWTGCFRRSNEVLSPESKALLGIRFQVVSLSLSKTDLDRVRLGARCGYLLPATSGAAVQLTVRWVDVGQPMSASGHRIRTPQIPLWALSSRLRPAAVRSSDFQKSTSSFG